MKHKTARGRREPPEIDGTKRVELIGIFDWRSANDHLFGSDSALRWHMRQHRSAYANSGALLVIGGRLFVDPPKFEATLREIGREIAANAPGLATASAYTRPITEYSDLEAGCAKGGNSRARRATEATAVPSWRRPHRDAEPVCSNCSGSGTDPSTSADCERCCGTGCEPSGD